MNEMRWDLELREAVFSKETCKMKRLFQVSAVLCLFFTLMTPTSADEAVAKAAFLRGVNMLKDRNFSEAATAFETSIEEYPNPNALLNLALCYFELKQYFASRETFEKLLETFPDELDENKKKSIEIKLDELATLIPSLVIKHTPKEARIVVDGKELDEKKTAHPIFLPEGEHRIEVHKQGWKTEMRDITLNSGQHIKAVINLERENGTLSVAVNEPGATVRVDGKSVGVTPLPKPIALPEGRYRVEVIKEGFEPTEESVQVIGAKADTLYVSLKPIHVSSSSPNPVDMPWYKNSTLRLIVSASGAGVMSGISIGLWAATFKRKNDYDEKNSSLDYENGGEWDGDVVSARDRDEEAAKKYNNAAVATTSIAGAFIAWTVTELVLKLHGKRAERERLSWSPNSVKVRF
jgi:tetratricopeptide (TPR) repeat protein